MLITPIFLYLLILTVFFLATLLLAMISAQIELIKTLTQLKKKTDQEEDKLAQEKQKIIQAALEKAVQIEKKAQLDQEKITQMLNQEAQTLAENYRQQLASLSQQNLKQFNKELDQNLKETNKIIQTVSSQIRKQALVRVENEISHYKKKRLDQLEEEIYQIINQTAREVLGRSLSPQDHQQLIFTALNKAKRDLIK